MNRIARVLLGLLLSVPAAVSAQELRVEYLVGRLEVLAGGSWREARVGDALPQGCSVRLPAGSAVELSAGELRVTLHQPGTYAVGALLRASRQSLHWGLGRLLQSKLQTLFRLPAGESSGAMGVRAEEAGGEPDLGWMEGEEEERQSAAALREQAVAEQPAAEEVRGLLAQGRAAEAEAAATRALQEAGEEAQAYFRYLLASARALGGRQLEALQALEAVEVPEHAPYYPEYALLKAGLLVQGQDYGRAQALYDRLLAAWPQPAWPERAQPAWFFSAFCSLQLGDRAEARRRLEKARGLDPASELGMKAKELLSSL